MQQMQQPLERFHYDNKLPKAFLMVTIMWGVVGMLLGLLIAFQMAYPWLNFDFALTTFGRVRPVHTNAVIFAFVGNGIFMTIYYALPRLMKTSMFNEKLGWVNSSWRV
jgi:cytochrome c oxidase cbb3-type subunit I/II